MSKVIIDNVEYFPKTETVVKKSLSLKFVWGIRSKLRAEGAKLW